MAGIEIIWRLLRVPNLLLIAISQIFIWYLVMMPAFSKYGLHPFLDGPHFFLLVLCTMTIVAGGSAVNDLYDLKTDRINRPERQIVGRLISVEDTFRVYVILVLFGALIAGYLSYELGRMGVFLFYPAAVALLWSYSRYFKRLPVSGNLIVSLFVACVPLVLLIPEWKNVLSSSFLPSFEHKLIWSFAGFAFGSNLLRVFVKDIEAVKGDLESGSATLVVLIGPGKARKLAIFFSFLLLAGFVFWLLLILDKVSLANLIYYCVFMLGTLLVIIVLLFRAKLRQHFRQIRRLVHALIFLGLMYLFFF